MSRRFPFGKTGRVVVASAPRQEPRQEKTVPLRVQRTAGLEGFVAPAKVLPFVEVKAGEAPAVRPEEPPPTPAWGRGSAWWIALGIAVVLIDALAVWLILRRPS